MKANKLYFIAYHHVTCLVYKFWYARQNERFEGLNDYNQKVLSKLNFRQVFMVEKL